MDQVVRRSSVLPFVAAAINTMPETALTPTTSERTTSTHNHCAQPVRTTSVHNLPCTTPELVCTTVFLKHNTIHIYTLFECITLTCLTVEVINVASSLNKRFGETHASRNWRLTCVPPSPPHLNVDWQLFYHATCPPSTTSSTLSTGVGGEERFVTFNKREAPCADPLATFQTCTV